MGVDDRRLAGDRRPGRAGRPSGATVRAGWRSTTTCGPRRCCGSGRRCPMRSRSWPGPVLRELRMRKSPDGDRRAARGRRGDRPGARPDGGVAACRAHRARGGSRHRRRDRRRRARQRVDFVIVASGPNSASPHHEPVRPGDRGRRSGRRRHRRHDAERLLLGRDPHLRSRGARRTSSSAAYEALRRAQAAAVERAFGRG